MSELDAILSNFETAINADESNNPIQAEILNLSSQDPKKQERALREIINAALEESNREFITNRDGVGPLVHILSSTAHNQSYPILRVLAAHALSNLALSPSARYKIQSVNGTSALLSALSESSPGAAQLRERSLAVLANMTVSEDEYRYAIVRAGGSSIIVRAASQSSDPESTRTGLMVVANLAVNNDCARDLIQSGAVDACVTGLNSHDPITKRHALWACAALSASQESHSRLESRIGQLSYPVRENSTDTVDVIKCLTILVNLSGSDSAQSQMINSNPGLVNAVMRYLSGSEVNCKVMALQIAQNLGLTEFGQRAVMQTGQAGGVITAVRSLEDSPLIAHGFRAITNLAQNDEIRRVLVGHGGVDLVGRYAHSQDFDVRSSAEQALSNLTV